MAAGKVATIGLFAALVIVAATFAAIMLVYDDYIRNYMDDSIYNLPTTVTQINRHPMAHGQKLDYDYDNAYDYRCKQGSRHLMAHRHMRDYDYDYDYRGKQGGRHLMADSEKKDYGYDYDYRGKQGGRRLMAQGEKKDYDYDYDYRGKQGGRRLMAHGEKKDYDYDYDYRGKQGGRRLMRAHGHMRDYDYDYDYRADTDKAAWIEPMAFAKHKAFY